MKWILVVAVKCRHRENGLLKDVKIRPPLTYTYDAHLGVVSLADQTRAKPIH